MCLCVNGVLLETCKLVTDETNEVLLLLSTPFLPPLSRQPHPPSLGPVMSGNSADSYSEGESDGEQVKEMPEVPVPAPAPTPTPTLLYVRKGKNNGRVGRPKKLKNAQPTPPPPPAQPINRRRGSGQLTSGLFRFYNWSAKGKTKKMRQRVFSHLKVWTKVHVHCKAHIHKSWLLNGEYVMTSPDCKWPTASSVSEVCCSSVI